MLFSSVLSSYLVASLQRYAQFYIEPASVLQKNAFGSYTCISSTLLILVCISCQGFLVVRTGITHYVSWASLKLLSLLKCWGCDCLRSVKILLCRFIEIQQLKNFLITFTCRFFYFFFLSNRYPLGGSRGLRWSALIPMASELYFLTLFSFCFTEKVTDRLQWWGAEWAPGGWREFLREPGRMLIKKP